MENAEVLSYEDLQEAHASLQKSHEELQSNYEDLYNQLRELKRHIFGRKSEKLSVVSSAGQESLFPESDVTPPPPAEETEISAHKRSKRNGRKPLPKDIPTERIEYEPEVTVCPCCDEEMARIGEEVTEELDYIPAKFLKREHVRIKRACSRCKEDVHTSALPADVQVIEKSRAGAGLLAHIAVSKFCDHLPLYRQEEIYRRHGLELSRQTMCDWLGAVAELLSPITRQILQEILACTSIHADETRIKVQRDKIDEKEGLHTGYLWGALAPPGVYFHYSPSRGSEVANELLGDYKGYIHIDGYAGYNDLFIDDTCVRVGCFAHVRRKFIEIQKSASKQVTAVLTAIAALYKIEKQAKVLAAKKEETRTLAEIRVELRENKSKKITGELHALLLHYRDSHLPKHPLHEPIAYALNQWEALSQFLHNGEIEIDNNKIEQQIRPIAVGRKNYLFAGSHEGAKRAAIFYTVINTCKMHSVNPFHYISDILRKVHTHPNSKISELTPLNWRIAQDHTTNS